MASSGSYPAAAAAAAAFAAQNRQVRGKGRGYLGNYPGMLGEYRNLSHAQNTLLAQPYLHF